MVHQFKGKSSLKGQNEGKLARAVAGNNTGTCTSFGNQAATHNLPIPSVCERTLFAEIGQQKAEAYRLLFRNERALC
jgi:hypothetical protein